MKSIAIYSRHEDTDNETKNPSKESIQNFGKNQVHINIWKTYVGNLFLTPRYFFDFGIMTSSFNNRICIFLPFEIKHCENTTYDLCDTISKQQDLLCAIFNAELITSNCPNSCFTKVSKEEEDDTFYLYELGNNNIDVQPYTEGKIRGTRIKISINGHPNNNNYEEVTTYIRFRVEATKSRQVVLSEGISNDLIQAAFSTTDLFDIRVNEIREIGNKIQEEMTTNKYVPFTFKKIHLFYITDTHENVNNESRTKNDCRLLENNHWDKYIPENDLKERFYLAYHWKSQEKTTDIKRSNFSSYYYPHCTSLNRRIINLNNDYGKNLNEFSIFFSTVYPRLKFIRLTSYLSVVILLGWVGSGLDFDICSKTITESPWEWTKFFIIVSLFLFIIVSTLVRHFKIQHIKIFRKR